MDPLVSAILDAVFASLADAVGLSDWLRQRLKGDPAQLAFRLALTQALTDAAAHFPGRDLRYFAEILRDLGGPLLARALQPAAPFPTAAELTQLWLNHLTIDSAIHYQADFTRFATLLLDQLRLHLENQAALQWVAQARTQKLTLQATERLAAATAQNAATLVALRADVRQWRTRLETQVNVNTGGGSYIAGNAQIGGDFIGRDKVIKNYFVSGLARLVIDYSARIQDFLREYLGSKRQRVPFGGRQPQLDELHAWLDDSAAPPYYLMAAEAGRGKSALVCRWLAQLTTRPDLDVIFVPISLRFETATQDVVFAALAARLANLYESEPDKLPPASLTAEQWKGVCQSYLRREPPAGKRLVVILDGLDEATGWTPGRGLFSSDPPDGLRVLVTARTRPGETGASGWATTLGWENPQLARTATLHGLDRHGMEEALASMGNPLDTLATQVDVVGELYRLSEGDPLLVRLYVDELVKQGPAVAALRAEDLHNIQPGLPGYFDRWWQDQQEQWRLQGRDPIVEQVQLRLLLNAIAAGLGPLRLDDLAALPPELGDSLLVRRLAQQVNRWLVGDGKTQGYSYSHPRLGYYFWEQLGNHEQAAWDGRFCAWGERVLAELNAGTLASAAAPSYLLQHYAAHLERSAAPPERFYALISDGWRKAWEVLDVSYAGFLNDVDLAWMRAEQAYNFQRPGRAVALVQQVRAALCRASVAALGSNLPPELLAQLVEVGARTPMQALAIVKLVPDGWKQADMLIPLAAWLAPDLLTEALTITLAIEDEGYRARALGMLALRLPEPQKSQVLTEALTVARTIRLEYDCVQLLDELAPHLPKRLLTTALSTAQAIKHARFRAHALVTLAPHLPEQQRVQVLAMALTATQALEDESDRAEVLGALAPHLLDQQQAQILKEALVTAQAIKDEYFRIDRLAALVPQLPEQQRSRVLVEALTAAQALENEHARAAALSALAPHLPGRLLSEVLMTIQLLKDESARADGLRALAPHLPESLLTKVLMTAQLLKDESARADLLSVLASHLPEQQRTQVLKEALTTAQTIRHKNSRMYALGVLAHHLPEQQRTQVLKEALTTAQTIEDQDNSVRALTALALYLPEQQRVQVWATALTAIQTIKDESVRARTLGAFAPQLPEQQRSQVLKEALTVAQMIKDDYLRIDTLAALVPYLPEPQQSSIVAEALMAAQLLEDESDRADVLGALAPHLPEQQRMQVLKEALTAAQTIESEEHRTEVMSGLAPLLPESLLVETLTAFQAIENESIRTEALGMLAPHLPNNLLGEALIVSQAIDAEFCHARALSTLILHLSEPQRTQVLMEAWAAAQAVSHESARAAALTALIPYLPESLLSAVLTVAQAIWWHEDARAEILNASAAYLPESLLVEALMVAQTTRNERSREKALGALAPHLAAWSLRLPQLAGHVFMDSLSVLAARPRPEFLRDLAALMPFILALAGDEAPEAAVGIFHAIQAVCAWWP